MSARTLYDKLFDSHLVAERSDGVQLLYIDLHLIHEVTSPQAFEGLRLAGRQPWRRESVVATMDHVIPTAGAAAETQNLDRVEDATARLQLKMLRDNCSDHHLRLYGMGDERQGIVHVIGPEQGFTQPGMTVVCGDSHTSTHGALGALATGIGTSDVEHVLATQCLLTQRQKSMRINFNGLLAEGVSSKDMILHLIGRLGINGGSGHAMEFAGEAVRALSVEARMTMCNMAVEAGSRNGMVAVDETTLQYVRTRPFAPTGELLERAEEYWADCRSDEGALFDRELDIEVDSLAPQITWGTSPDMVVDVDQPLPDPSCETDAVRRAAMEKAYSYMGLEPGKAPAAVELDQVFIGSCTNSRIEDMRQAAQVVAGHRVSKRIKRAMVVPGSKPVQLQAEAEGLADIFVAAGFEWRRPGCSMCLAMNPDRLEPEERCASTSNRNFEGRQGRGGRTHLVSPASAAAAAIAGHFVDVREFVQG